MAGICFWLIMFPIDAIKSRIQVFKPNTSFLKYTLEIIKNEGKIYFLNTQTIIFISQVFLPSIRVYFLPLFVLS